MLILFTTHAACIIILTQSLVCKKKGWCLSVVTCQILLAQKDNFIIEKRIFYIHPLKLSRERYIRRLLCIADTQNCKNSNLGAI